MLDIYSFIFVPPYNMTHIHRREIHSNCDVDVKISLTIQVQVNQLAKYVDHAVRKLHQHTVNLTHGDRTKCFIWTT